MKKIFGGLNITWVKLIIFAVCAGAYTAKDMYFQHAFKDRCLKFGYFPNIADLNINSILEERDQDDCIKILWCARFIEWKHPEMAILLAERLFKKGYGFELNMIGSGPLYNRIEAMIDDKGLSSCVHLLGNYPNDEVLEIMSKHHIFIFTSDRNEGWGLVRINKSGSVDVLLKPEFDNVNAYNEVSKGNKTYRIIIDDNERAKKLKSENNQKNTFE